MIIKNLYDRGYIVSYEEGDQSLHRGLIQYMASVDDIYHTIGTNDTLHIIARKYYKSSALWFIIADVNAEIEDIFNLPIGSSILVPNISIIQSGYGRTI